MLTMIAKKRLLAFLTVVMMSFDLFADTIKREQLIRIVGEELKEVQRLNNQQSYRNPRILLRMAELFLEKARLLRDGENERYLSTPYNERRKKKKSSYFRQSNSYFKKAQKTCQIILKRHKRFQDKGDVYYIMAFNAKEFGQRKKSERYLKLAIKSSRKNSLNYKKSQIALAETLYNKKKYHKAIQLYERSLTKKDKWWTKDSLNLAWSYLRVNKSKQAINLMNEIYRRSKQSGRYIDMSISVERDLPYFYVYAGRISDAVKFYKKQGKNVGKNLIRVAKNAERLGKPKVAKKILEDTLNYAKNDDELQIKVLITLLPLYEKYGNTKKHLDTSKKLLTFEQRGRLDPDEREILVYQVKKMSAVLQKQVVSKRYNHNKKWKNFKGRMAVSYFSIAGMLEKNKSGSYSFHEGETLYALGKHDEAIEKHFQSLRIAQKNGEKKMIRLSLNSLLSSLGQKDIPKKTKDKYLERVYLTHIRVLPRSKKSEKISQRLFNYYVEKKELKKAEQTLKGYAKLYPKRKSTQEAMIAKMMDHYRKIGDKKSFNRWIGKLKRFEYSVSKKYMDQLQKIYLSMELKKIEKATSKGNKKRALAGYLAIYKSKTASKEAKKNSAYNIAVLFKELSHAGFSYRWTKKSLSIMNEKDVYKYRSTFLMIANDLFNQQEIKMSAEINEIVLKKMCKKRSKELNLAFTNASVLYFAENNFDRVRRVLSVGKKCQVKNSLIKDQQLALIKGYVEVESWSNFERELKRVSASKKNYPFLIEYLDRYRIALVNNGRFDVAKKIKNKIFRYYTYSRRNNYPIPLESLDVIANFEINKIKKEQEKLESFRLAFPEKVYKMTLEKKLQKVGRLEEQAIGVMKIGSGIGIVKANRIIESSYNNLAREIASFNPPYKTKEEISGFKKAMAEVSNSLKVKANSIRNTAKKQILRDKILSQDNIWFVGTKSPTPFPLYYIPTYKGVIMDRGGRK